MQFSQLWSGLPAQTHMKEENATVCINFIYLYYALLGIALINSYFRNHISKYNPQYL